MKLKIDKTPEIVELFARMASAKKDISEPANEAFAATFSNQIANTSLDQEITSNRFFEVDTLTDQDRDEIPLDPLWGPNSEEFSVWFQTMGGGLPTNHVGRDPILKITFYDLMTAISFDKRWLSVARPEVVARYMERMINALWVKCDLNRWASLLTATAQSSIGYFPNGVATTPVQNTIQGVTPGFFSPQDFNNLWILSRRLNAAWTNRTPVGTQSKGPTAIVLSPTQMGSVRSWAYNPVNTRNGDSNAAGNVALPDDVRSRLFSAGGVPEIFGVELIEDLGFGVGYDYNNIFKAAAGAITYSYITGGGTASMTNTQEVVLAIDETRGGLYAPQRNTPQILVDDQFRIRDKKVGYWTEYTTAVAIASTLPLSAVLV